MSDQILLQLAGVLILGIAVQWMAWRTHLPAILLLLATGLILGPGSMFLAQHGWLPGPFLDPNELFGDLLLPAVSLAVALVLFEGGLTLNLREHKASGATIWLLVTVGAAITFTVAFGAATFLLRLDWQLSFLLAAILIVTGPTVIGPLLRQVRPTGKVGGILKWEGIIIDPLGAMFAIVVFEALVSRQLAPFQIVRSAAIIILVGTSCGAVTAAIIIWFFRRHWVPDFLHNGFVLVMVLLAFAGANAIRHESGLFAATLLGLILGNQRQVNVQHVREFKESLSVLLVSALFIVLGARLTLEQLALVPWLGILGFLAVMILIARPLAVFVTTLFSSLTWKERGFLAGLAPRGVVAAAVASVFALRLDQQHFAQANLLVPIVFATIIGTVTFYGLSAQFLARKLGLAVPGTQGLLIAGAGPFERALAHALTSEGRLLMLVDTNRQNIAAARLQGFSIIHGSILSRFVMDETHLAPLGQFLALTSNDEVNALAAMQYQRVFSRSEVYQLAPHPKSNARQEKIAQDLHGRVLFAPDLTYEMLEQRIEAGEVIRKTTLTADFGYAEFQKIHAPYAVPLFLRTQQAEILFFTVERLNKPKPGDLLFYLAPPKPQGEATPADSPPPPAKERQPAPLPG